MLQLPKLTHFAILVLAELSKTGELGMSPSVLELAQRTELPQPTVSRLLKRLSFVGLVVSVRGTLGGYRLDRDARSISLAEVIDAMDQRSGKSSDEVAPSSGGLLRRNEWLRRSSAQMNRAVRAALREISVADMVDPEREPPPSSGARR